MSPRQQYILSAIVEAYAKTAEPVSSQQLTEKIEVSSATIRAEMAELERLGHIYQPHTSAGRVPTDKGYRLYVNNLEQLQADSRVSHALARRIASAGEADARIKQAAESLAEATGNLGLATLSDSLYFSGLSNLFGQPEFLGPQGFEVARLLDSLGEWLHEAQPAERVSVYIGGENPIGRSSGATLVVSKFSSPYSDRSYIGVLGPTRQNYPRVMGLVDYAGRHLEEVLA
ncbi:MAG TPA: HTH domain-containing protein [Candidatus Saccharimonadales bacterium]|nr:HTH domain-containing protein [Candidatus Saccharimonadales bacterium]